MFQKILLGHLIPFPSIDDPNLILAGIMTDKLALFRLLLSVASLGLAGISSLFASVAAIPVLNVNINFAGAGGDFSSRTATFRVPDSTTVTPVENGLRLYEIHLAKMIEVTESFCKDRDSDYIIYWNYEADEGKIFMGEFSLSCQFARETLEKFGTSGTEEVTIHHRGNPTSENISILNLNSKNAKQFRSLVQSLKPSCIETTPKICPGDRLE
jgi:serine/threonine-protein kinase